MLTRGQRDEAQIACLTGRLRPWFARMASSDRWISIVDAASYRFAIMPKRSAGLLLYRRKGQELELLLVHPGGPFWAKKDDGAWSIPKGLYEEAEDPFAAAQREFEEETGCPPPAEAIALGSFKQPGGKVITAFAAEGDFDLRLFRSNLFAMEWPPKSGKRAEFPEADRAGWFTPADALRKVTKGQVPIVQTLLRTLESPSREETV